MTDATASLSHRFAWKRLDEHHSVVANLHLRELFAQDPARGERMVAEGAGLFLDYSKHRLTEETISLLVDLANE
jgi:glucose-6-phosphate isomerase